MALKFFDKLSQNFIELLNDKDDYNVIIEVENKEKSFTEHSNILKYRSTYFRRIVNLENVETRFVFDLMLPANEFELKKLTNKLETLIINTKNFLHPSLIFESSDFTSLPESTLVSLLKRDDLQKEEVKIWDNIIKWGIAQILLFLKTLENVKSIISPARSTIVSEEHAAEISTWIDRKTINYSTTNIPCKFEIISSGTRDGFTPETFWNICHGHVKTVLAAKIIGTDEILGCYNPLDGIILMMMHGVSERKQKIVSFSHEKWYYFFLHSKESDFTLDYRNYCNIDVNNDNYEKPLRTSSFNFSIVNYEVFKLFENLK
ncbi:hypothetical protein Glove_13g194 [Diversispora epigaea]|uniref:BACK domain-containing protein n=1 Tax=Diversispora epigaea TaxID=1348612 RepID=A0A397JXI1_9GLOM|nr:hypothetical protein Glove_13g194 [Diversispora epigaea]